MNRMQQGILAGTQEVVGEANEQLEACTTDVLVRVRTVQHTARHGTKTAYDNYGCRCDRCLKAVAAAKRAYRANLTRDAKGVITAPGITHGRPSAAALGCSCAPCKACKNTYYRDHRRQLKRYIRDGVSAHPKVRHGSRYAYKYYACRCASCVQAYQASYKNKRKRS